MSAAPAGHGGEPGVGTAPAGGACVACVVGKFPSLSETFVLREVLALRAAGVPVLLCALERHAHGKVHAEAAALAHGVVYNPGRGAAGRLLPALLRWLCGRPGTCCRLLCTEQAAGRGGPRALYHLAVAAHFADAARRHGARHVHAHFALVPADIGRMLAALLQCRWSLSVHARDLYTQPDAVLAARVAGAEFIAACTEHGRQHLLRAAPALVPGRVLLVRHGLMRPEAMPRAGAVPGTVLAVGRLEEKKGFATLIEACRLLATDGLTTECVLAGDGPLRAALAAQAVAAGVAGQTRFVGAVTQTELAGLLARAAVFVLPSVVAADGDRDGLPNALLEAMAAGLPVVSTTASACDEVVRDGRTGLLVAPGDAPALAGALGRLLRDPPSAARLGAAARERVLRDFDAGRNVAPLAARFRVLLGDDER